MRLHVFIIAQTLIECDIAYGFCSALASGHAQETGESVSVDKLFYLYPEIAAHKPEITFDDDWWFPTDEEGKQTRLDILQIEIDKLKPNG